MTDIYDSPTHMAKSPSDNQDWYDVNERMRGWNNRNYNDKK